MYDWLLEIHILIAAAGAAETYLQLNSPGVSEAELAEVEQELNIILPPSYKEFLRCWNGGRLVNSTLLSSGQLLEYAERCGFEPWSGLIEFLTPQDDTYQDKPAHHLVFRIVDSGQGVYCFDTAVEINGELAICKYEAGFDLTDHLDMRYPSFEAMLMFEVYWQVVSEMYEVLKNYEETGDEEADPNLEAQLVAWEEELRAMLFERGADLSEMIRPNWDNWQ